MWELEYSKSFHQAAKKLDHKILARTRKYLMEVAELPDPTLRGKALAGNLRGYWRYRIGNYRVICEIDRGKLIVIAITIAHRREIYRQK